MYIAREPAFGCVIVGIGRMIAGCSAVFRLQIYGAHDMIVLTSLREGQLGPGAEEEEGEEGGEAVEVGGGDEFVSAREGF